MRDRATRVALIVMAALLALFIAQPYLNTYLFSAREARPVTARGDLSAFEQSTIRVFETVAPSVVQVVSLSQRGRGADAEPNGSGTGFVWDAAGHIVTNEHVVANGSGFAVRLASGEVLPAEVVGRAPNYDLAVLRLSRRAGLPAPVAVGSSADLKVGQTAYAIGNPFGLDQSLTTGIISALKRRLPTSGGREIADVIQTDAAINPGNSGVIGDVIVGIEDAPVRRLSDLTDQLERAGVDQSVALKVMRGNATRTVNVRVVDVGEMGRRP
jgi:2-alkenal reductase